MAGDLDARESPRSLAREPLPSTGGAHARLTLQGVDRTMGRRMAMLRSAGRLPFRTVLEPAARRHPADILMRTRCAPASALLGNREYAYAGQIEVQGHRDYGVRIEHRRLGECAHRGAGVYQPRGARPSASGMIDRGQVTSITVPKWIRDALGRFQTCAETAAAHEISESFEHSAIAGKCGRT